MDGHKHCCRILGAMVVRSSTKRIARNTIWLYLRMLLCMGISFFTTRIILNALGVIDYGLVNAIGGVVGMFSFVSMPLSTASSRYFSYDLGRGDIAGLSKTFSQVLILYAIGVVLIAVLLETVGLWYMANKLVVPDARFHDALLFFHMTVLTVAVNLLSVPYVSMIISYENMGLYSVLSIFDAVIKLILSWAVAIIAPENGLVIYGVLLLLATVLHTFLNFSMAVRLYPACKFKWYFDRSSFKSLCAFNWWQLFGSFAWTSSEVFVNLLLNSFFGPVVNAARGISAQVMSGVFGFTHNFLTASRPQIVKLWAAGDKDAFYKLFKRTSKVGFGLLLLMAVPISLELDYVFKLWLKTVPEYSVAFTKIIIVTSLVNTFSHPIVYAAQAVGKIALFEGIGSGVKIIIWPLSWVALRFGFSPVIVFYIGLAVTVLCVAIRYAILVRISGIPGMDYVVNVFLRMFVTAALAFGISYVVFASLHPGFIRFIIVGAASVLSVCVSFAAVGFEAGERRIVVELFRRGITGMGKA